MSQLIDSAIRQSRTQNETVHVSRTEIRQAGLSVESVHRELFEACECETKNGSVHEYWGHGTDGADDEPWRVHVPAE